MEKLMNEPLLYEDQIQKEILDGASEEEIRRWLEKNGIPEDAIENERPGSTESLLNYRGLRAIYEPYWAGKSPLTRLYVCLYGQHLETLKELFASEIPDHHKFALIKNRYFSENLGNLGKYGLTDLEFLKELYKNNRDLFFNIFYENKYLTEEFLSLIFAGKSYTDPRLKYEILVSSHDGLYDEIEKDDIIAIIDIIFDGSFNYFNERKNLYKQNNWTKQGARGLTEIILDRVPDLIRHIFSKYQGQDKRAYDVFSFFLISILHLIRSSEKMETNGFPKPEDLLLFEPWEYREGFAGSFQELDTGIELHADVSDYAYEIQVELARRAYENKSDWDDDLSQLDELLNYDTESIRFIYYQNISLERLYNLKGHQLESGFRFLSDDFEYHLGNIIYEDDEFFNEIENVDAKVILLKIKEIMEKDSEFFLPALIQNKRHYRTQNRRNFLKSLIKMDGDARSKYPPPLYWYRNITRFEEIARSVQDKNPEYFSEEEASNDFGNITKKLNKDIEQNLLKLGNEIKKFAIDLSNFTESNKKLEDELKLLKKEVSESRNQAILFQDRIDQTVREPTDLFSKILLKIPVVGPILRLFSR